MAKDRDELVTNDLRCLFFFQNESRCSKLAERPNPSSTHFSRRTLSPLTIEVMLNSPKNPLIDSSRKIATGNLDLDTTLNDLELEYTQLFVILTPLYHLQLSRYYYDESAYYRLIHDHAYYSLNAEQHDLRKILDKIRGLSPKQICTDFVVMANEEIVVRTNHMETIREAVRLRYNFLTKVYFLLFFFIDFLIGLCSQYRR